MIPQTGTTGLFERVAARTKAWEFFHWYWGDAIAVDGMLEAGPHDSAGVYGHTVEQLQRWAESAPSSESDALAPGRAISHLVMHGELPRLAADRFIAAVERLPITSDGIPLLEPGQQQYRFGVCIDALYHLPAGIAAYGRLAGDTARVQRAVDMAITIMDRLSCPNGWAQWYDTARQQNNQISWSRGLGWALVGLSDLLDETDEVGTIHHLDDVRASVRAVMNCLVQTQQPDGNWPSVLGDFQAPSETSTAAFFTIAASHPQAVRCWQPPLQAIKAADEAVRNAIDADGVAQGVSADILPDWNPASYRTFAFEPSPWGQGAALRALAAIRDRDGTSYRDSRMGWRAEEASMGKHGGTTVRSALSSQGQAG